ANAIRYTGALPVLVDADPDTWQMQVPLVAGFLRTQCRRDGGRLLNRRTGRRVAALMPVHIHGHPVEMDGLCQLAEEFGLPIVEDATEALGSVYNGRKLGAI